MKKLLCLTIVCILVLGLSACGQKNEKKSDDSDYYEFGVNAKEEGNLEEAEANFKEALNEDDEDILSYLELADVYIRQNKFRDAYEILKLGEEKTGSATITDKLLDFNSANVVTDSDNLVRGRVSFGGENAWYHVYSYNESGERTGITHYGADDAQINHIDFKYNSSNMPTTYYAYYSNGNIEMLNLEYNSANDVISITEYETDNTTISGYTYIEYDENGDKIKETRVYADGNPHWEHVYTYNDDNTGLMIAYFEGKQAGRMEFTLDELGRITSSKSTGMFTTSIDYGYDYEGNRERVEIIDGGTGEHRTVCYGSSFFEDEE